MFVEASRMDGEGQLTLTGQLGDVMKESAHLAISWLRSNAKTYRLTNGERSRPAEAPLAGKACGSGSRRRLPVLGQGLDGLSLQSYTFRKVANL